MPGPDQILEGVTRIAREWQWLAALWHALVAALLLLILARRVSPRAVALTLSAMIASVSAMAWWSANWFNGVVFGALAIEMTRQSVAMPDHPCGISRRWLPAGLAALAFGWIYPHFLGTQPLWVYAYAAPLGLIPCPSLAAVIGLTLMVNLLESPRWAITIGAAGLVYGVIGVARLGVRIDVWLIAAAVAAIVAAIMMRRAAPSGAGLPGRPAPGSARA